MISPGSSTKKSSSSGPASTMRVMRGVIGRSRETLAMPVRAGNGRDI